MVEKTVRIVNPGGMHARPASQIVKFARRFDGTVEAVKGEQVADLKSILTLLSMGLKKGAEITLRVAGEGERAFLEELARFILELED